MIHYRHLEGGELEVAKNNIYTPFSSVGFGRTLWCWREAAGIWSFQNASGDTVSHWALLYFIAERHFFHNGLRLTF